MKKITLLGDSIRMGYGQKVIEILARSGIEVFQPDENCRFAKYTLRMLFDYAEQIGGSNVIHWNNGLWDVSDLFGDGRFTPTDEYVRDMLRIADNLLKITPKVIFATTTPVRDGYPYQTCGDIERLNAEIVPPLKDRGIIINDLYSLVAADRERYLRSDDRLHLTDEGAEKCAKRVAEMITGLL